MDTINSDYFFSPIMDKELNQYKILAILKKYRELLNKNKLYPTLAHLTRLYNQLKSFQLKNEKKLNDTSIKAISDTDYDSDKKMYEAKIDESTEIIELINWALPQIESLMQEGNTIYDFVSGNISIDIIKPEPQYKDEGYILIPEIKTNQLFLVEYLLSYFKSGDKLFHSLKTNLVSQAKLKDESDKIAETGFDLINRFGNMVNPAVFLCRTDLDFPFSETVFPIVKSKVLSFLIN